jgi:hypothetical protein
MAGFVDITVKDIDARLAELREEVRRLEEARTALVGTRGPGRPPGTTSAAKRGSGKRGPGRPRGKRGGNTRAKEALELVRTRPGISIPEIAAELSILPNYLYRVMPKLIDAGDIRREGQGYFPAGGGEA